MVHSQHWFERIKVGLHHHRAAGILAVLILASLSTRLLPLSISPYPFNNDSMTECSIAEGILETGRLGSEDGRLGSASSGSVTPAHPLVLALAAATIGTSTFDVAQVTVAVFSILTVVGIYLVALRITGNTKSALAASTVVLAMGTFVYVTGSAWRESLGIALMVLVLVAYMTRSDKRMLVLELVGLALLPLVHHLVAFLTYSVVAYLTIWSVAYALQNGRVRPRHVVDAAVISTAVIGAYIYYSATSFYVLSDVLQPLNLFVLVVSFAVFAAVIVLVLSKESHAKGTFAPIPATLVFVLFALDYFNPLFPYEPGAPSNVFLLGLSVAVLVGFAWFGFEVLIESGSRYRAVPVCLMMPVLALLGYAVVSGLDLFSLKIAYRSFDFADLAIALGIGACLNHYRGSAKNERRIVVILIAVLLVSFPFGYATNSLTGVRHDTQQYELDAMNWVGDSTNHSLILESDIRLAYNAKALWGIDARPDLVPRLAFGEVLHTKVYCMLLEEWTQIGVDSYPYGHPLLSEAFTASILESSNVVYLGGPASNNVVIFRYSPIGWADVF